MSGFYDEVINDMIADKEFDALIPDDGIDLLLDVDIENVEPYFFKILEDGGM